MRIDHVAIQVADLEGARRFFEHYFQGKSNNMYHNPRTGLKTYFISFADGTRIELMYRPPVESAPGPSRREGYVHMSMSVGSREGVDSLTRRLADDGYEVIDGPRTTGDGFYESCIRGFEGNLMEITV